MNQYVQHHQHATREKLHIYSVTDKPNNEFHGDPMLTFNISTVAAFCEKIVFFLERNLVCSWRVPLHDKRSINNAVVDSSRQKFL
jgi:hypothetical protein